jgi:VanZ family protein
MKRYFFVTAFFIFILFIIWEANHNGTNYFFRSVEMLPFKDKIGHFTLYGLLAFLLDLALRGRNWKLFKRYIPAAFVIVMTFAIAEEITQYWIPARNFDLIDALADFFGVCAFVALSRIFLHYRTNLSHE